MGYTASRGANPSTWDLRGGRPGISVSFTRADPVPVGEPLHGHVWRVDIESDDDTISFGGQGATKYNAFSDAVAKFGQDDAAAAIDWRDVGRALQQAGAC